MKARHTLKSLLILIFFCFPLIGNFCGTVDPAYAGNVVTMFKTQVVASYTDILFYHDMEQINAHYSAGDSTSDVTESAAISSTQHAVGSNSMSIPSVYSSYDYDVSGANIVDHLSGRIGFYLYYTTWGNVNGLFKLYYDANNQITVMADTGTNNHIHFSYTSGGSGGYVNCNSSTGFSASTWYFVELRWNQGGAGNDFECYVNGESAGTADDASGAWAGTPTVMYIGDNEGNNAEAVFIDQFFSSNDPTRDLDAIKDCTTCHP